MSTKTQIINIDQVRKDFPILNTQMNGKPLVYLDNAASTQKPQTVIDRIAKFYRDEYATVSRGVYALSQQATIECAQVREKCRALLNAAKSEEIIFVRGATEGINLIASAYGEKFLKPGDEVIVSHIEHHANFVPWQQLCKKSGATFKVIPVNDSGELLLDEYKKLLTDKTKIVAVGQVSNALGTINPIKEIISLAHGVGAVTVIDGAQGIPHLRTDVQDLDADFYVFSGHKIFAPTGVGVLYGKEKLLAVMDPYQCGGEMVQSVTIEETTFAQAPQKFEAGTTAFAQIIGLGAALDYVNKIGLENIAAYEHELLLEATQKLEAVEGLRIIGTAANKASVISFELKDIHPHDIGTIVDQEGVAIRTGHHCAQPTMKRFGVPATARASFCFYNTKEEIDALVAAIEKVKQVFS